MHTLYLAKLIVLKHRLQLQHNSCSASLHVCIFTSLTTFLSSNIQSSQVQLYRLNTLRNVPCSPPLANLPIQLSMAGTESLVLSLYSVAQVFVCRKSKSHKSFLPGRHHVSNLNYFSLRIKNHHSINSTWGRVKQKFQIKHRLSLETYCLHFFSLFLRGISWKKKQNTRLEGEWINRAAVWGRSKVIKIHSCVHRHSTPTSNADELCQLELHNEIFSLHKTPKSEAALEKFTLVTTLSPEGRTAEAKWVKPRVYLPLQATGQEAWIEFFFQPAPAFAPPGMLSSYGCRLLSIFAFPMIHHQILHKSTERKQSEWVTTYKIQTHSTWKR